jgi:hypothetical protein
MPEPIRKKENELTVQLITDLLVRLQEDESSEKRSVQPPRRGETTPSRDLVLRVIDGLKRA